MKAILSLAMVCGLALGVFVVGPRLADWSPWLAILVGLVLLLVTSYFEVQRRERALDEEVRRRFPLGTGPKPPTDP